tara:strand:+ start:948 stop:1070 length:123 start_codon:yes stop_codon:yes gene_type:complete
VTINSQLSSLHIFFHISSCSSNEIVTSEEAAADNAAADTN